MRFQPAKIDFKNDDDRSNNSVELYDSLNGYCNSSIGYIFLERRIKTINGFIVNRLEITLVCA